VNLPNALTMLRIALVPVLAWFMWQDDVASLRWAALVFVLAALTDVADGAIARSRGLITTFGAIADPIADKALIGTALIGLSLLDRLPWWVTIVILVREIAVTVMRIVVLRHSVIPASRGGKAKTFVQIAAIVMLLVAEPTGVWGVACAVVVLLAVVLTVATGIDYAVRAGRLRAARVSP
jgi:CDP-diacylglycerol---glycerol-3-phosphate 3-phosphatidyltransferase